MSPSFLDTGLIDLLEADPRPSFIVALTPEPPTIVYTNPAFSANDGLLSIIAADAANPNAAKLWQWITNTAPSSRTGPNPVPSSMSYASVYWTRAVVQEQMVVVGANEQLPPKKVRLDVAGKDRSVSPPPPRLVTPDEPLSDPSEILSSGSPQPALPTPETGLRRSKSSPGAVQPTAMSGPVAGPEALRPLSRATSDPGWILPGVMPEQIPFLEVIHSVDWEATPLGPIDKWPPRLEQTFEQILVDSRPMAIYWGPQYVTIYNEAFSKLCGSKHPALLGMTVEMAWQEAGEQLKNNMRSIAQKQRGMEEDEWRFFVERAPDCGDGETQSWLEETYLKWSIIPIIENNECLGFMHPVVDTTSMRLWERRMKMLIDLGEVLVTARDVQSYWEKTLQELEAVEPRYDIPLAVLYHVEEDPDAMSLNSSTTNGSKVCKLAGTLGVPEGHPIAPATLNLGPSDEGLLSSYSEALSAQHPLLLRTADGTFPEHLFEGVEWRGFGDACRAAVIIPIRPTKEENAMGLLLLGLNPRRPYDNDYRQYISLLSQKLTTSLASIVLLEEEARRGRNAAEQAAYDQAMLKEKLAVQTRETNESIQRFEAVTEFVPVGMCFGDVEGNITFANDAWYKITGYPGTSPISNQGFLSCVKEEDRQIIVAQYEKLKTASNVEFEFRVKMQANEDDVPPPTRNSPRYEKAGLDLSLDDLRERHVLAAAKAERAADGSILRVLTCLTDVTAHKQTAEEAVRRAQQAENLKRMAEFATVGMYDMGIDGRLLGANNVFFEMCGVAKVDLSEVDLKPWKVCVVEEDCALLAEKINRMVIEDRVQTVEVRLKTTWTSDDGAGHKVVFPRWVQATLMPVKSSEGVVKSFTGCLTDVSLQKWQLEREKQRKEEAIESKRQQENFIDMTSHEMRNPLSAIIHCADAITATLSRVQELVSSEACGQAALANGTTDGTTSMDKMHTDESQADASVLVERSIDNAETIVECAQHQKRIVDDILTMSKLDSKLLAITPITVNPIQMVQEALKMFEVEARRVDITLSMVICQSYRDLGIRFLDIDPSRLKQVLINLLTNALKFTKTGPTRNVSVAVSASETRPTEATSLVQFIPRSQEDEDGGSPPPAPRERGKPVYLIFEVKDTGQGLSEEEKKSLFQRFVQASSRTHVKYGGSGLGLFISRRLTELQNGAIGVASQPGVGSTFAFYIEAATPSEAALRDAEAAADATEKAAAAAGLKTSSGGGGRTKRSTQQQQQQSPGPAAALLHPAPPIRGILVVEDNLINQQITRRGLAGMGFTVDVANHGIECLEKLGRTDRFVRDGDLGTPGGEGAGMFPLSIILMDIEMPVQDGLTCTRKIRELEGRGKIRGGRLPIIAVSANARLEQIVEAKEAGCDDVLVKPYRMPELLEKMRLVMGRLGGEEGGAGGVGEGEGEGEG